MNNILLLGGTGFIGKNIIESFSKDSSCNLIVLTRNTTSIESSLLFNTNVTVITGELKNIEFIKGLIAEQNINVIIHLLSSLIPSSSEIAFYESIQSVIVPTFQLIDYIADKNIKLIFFSSGGTIYGNVGEFPIKEDNTMKPINNYGLSKLMVENYISFKNNKSSLDYVVLRPSNVYGKYQTFEGNQGFISVAINKIFNDIPIEIWGDGSSVRDYVHVDDVVFTVKKIIDQSISKVVLNLSTGIGKSLLEIIAVIENVSKRKAIVNFDKKRGVDADTVILDNSLLQSVVPQQHLGIEDGIKRQVEYFNTIVFDAN